MSKSTYKVVVRNKKSGAIVESIGDLSKYAAKKLKNAKTAKYSPFQYTVTVE